MTGTDALRAIRWAEVAPRVVAATFPATAAQVPLARAWVCLMMAAHGCREDIGTATLLVGELATNAVQHAATEEFTVRLDFGDGLRAAVHDHDTTPPMDRRRDPLAPGGHGLTAVAGLADDWGTVTVEDGKWVWFHVRTWPGRIISGAVAKQIEAATPEAVHRPAELTNDVSAPELTRE